NPVVAVNNQGPGLVQPPRFSARSAPAAEGSSFFGELLHAVVASFHDIQVPPPVEGQVGRIGKLSGFGAGLAPAADQFAAAGKDLDAVIGAIAHMQEAVRSQSQRPDPSEFSRLGPRSAPALDESTVRIELADAFVLGKLCDIVIPFFVLHGVADIG